MHHSICKQIIILDITKKWVWMFSACAHLRRHRIGSIRTFHFSRRLSKMAFKIENKAFSNKLTTSEKYTIISIFTNFFLALVPNTQVSESSRKKIVFSMSSEIRSNAETSHSLLRDVDYSSFVLRNSAAMCLIDRRDDLCNYTYLRNSKKMWKKVKKSEKSRKNSFGETPGPVPIKLLEPPPFRSKSPINVKVKNCAYVNELLT